MTDRVTSKIFDLQLYIFMFIHEKEKLNISKQKVAFLIEEMFLLGGTSP